MPQKHNTLRFLAGKPNADELARFVCLSEFVNPSPTGCSFAFIHPDGMIYELGRFGSAQRETDGGEVSFWSDYSHVDAIRKNLASHVLAQKINEQADKEDWSFKLDEGVKSVLVFPVVAKEVPVAVLSFLLSESPEGPDGWAVNKEYLTLTTLIAMETENIRRSISSLGRSSAQELTDTEIEIISLIARGFSNKQISQEQLVSIPTVKSRISGLLKKFDARNRKELVRKTRELI